MDSINKNQPEHNFENLAGQEGIDKIKELAKSAGSCFFCTKITTGASFATTPMSPQKIDDQGNIWFVSALDSHKNEHIAQDPAVQLLFQGSSYSDFLTLYGKATITTDKQKIDELWEPMMKTWFTEGKDDSRISVIKFTPEEGYYWDAKHVMAVGMIKRAVGAIMGETYDDSIEGTIKP